MANLQDLPPELIAMVTTDLDYGSHMSLKLASKTLFSKVGKVRPPQLHEWIDFNLNFEQRVPRRRVLPMLTCTMCAKLHPRAKFSDAQSKKTNPTRFCIRYGTIRNKYYSRGTFRVGGVVMFGCDRCHKAWPVAEEASYNIKHQLPVRFCKRCWRFTPQYLAKRSHEVEGWAELYQDLL